MGARRTADVDRCNVESMAEDVAKLGSSTEAQILLLSVSSSWLWSLVLLVFLMFLVVFLLLLMVVVGLVVEEADDFVPVRTVAVDSFPQTVHVEETSLHLVPMAKSANCICCRTPTTCSAYRIEAIQLLERASIVEDPRKRQKRAHAEEGADATATEGDVGVEDVRHPEDRPPERQRQHEKILRAFRTALPESGYWTEKQAGLDFGSVRGSRPILDMVKLQPLQKCQVRVLLNALGVELSEERLRSMIDAVSSGSGKVTYEQLISWLFTCPKLADPVAFISGDPSRGSFVRGVRQAVLAGRGAGVRCIECLRLVFEACDDEGSSGRTYQLNFLLGGAPPEGGGQALTTKWAGTPERQLQDGSERAAWGLMGCEEAGFRFSAVGSVDGYEAPRPDTSMSAQRWQCTYAYTIEFLV
ncbi:hypothetical protein AK812_SmicGene9793 [Symbiodinium microadriaticum]|uniref:Uncharacterized protein n=1 Tax=Symbiodinium microadriaticum TaxID=2951 RepID=A0A1Q9EHI1_SYMMI|nr:hypothetical protein AK812_SmicGene9793 [Symbiodinium microadriaticum]